MEKDRFKAGGIMYVIYLRKKRIYAVLSLIALLTVLAWLTFKYFTMHTKVLSPIYLGNTEDKAVALMFNVDWGEEVVPALLQILQDHQIRATFFYHRTVCQKVSGSIAKNSRRGP